MTKYPTISIRLFATLKDLVGTNTITIELPPNTDIQTLRNLIVSDYPALSEALPNAIAAVNQEYVEIEHLVHPEDEVAFFPPVSGGSEDFPEVFILSEIPINLDELTAKIVTPATGAIALFSGYVRGETQSDGSVIHTSHLEYEAYEPMAKTKMKQVADEIREQWPHVQGIAIVQRIGHLTIGTPTVLIACASGHRNQGCFEAARYGIDRLKEIVPIWKKEHSPDGQHWVEGSYQPNPND